MGRIIRPAILIPLGVVIVEAIGIIAVGELYLTLGGDLAIIVAIVLMAVIAGVAALLTYRSGGDTAQH